MRDKHTKDLETVNNFDGNFPGRCPLPDLEKEREGKWKHVA